MKVRPVSTTSLLALLAFGSGRALAAPMASDMDARLFGTSGQSDVVLDSLSLGRVTAPTASVSNPAESPPAAEPGGQTPTATFTYRPSAPALSRRNPGNVSNLRGTIGSSTSGIFGVPAADILVNETPAAAYNFMLRPPLVVESDLVLPDTVETVPVEPFDSVPSQSVFVGVRPPVADGTNEAARRISILSATGSAAPTIRVLPVPRRTGLDAAPGDDIVDLGYRADAGLATTIGFSTARMRPTALPPGAAATSTLGYTYVPTRRRPAAPSAADATPPPAALLSATVTAPNGTLAQRDGRFGDAATTPDDAPARLGSAGIGMIAGERPLPGVAVDTFLVATAGRAERITIPIVLRGTLDEPDIGGESLYASDSIEMNTGHSPTQIAMLVAAVMVPLGLALLGFRMIRRTVLRRLE